MSWSNDPWGGTPWGNKQNLGNVSGLLALWEPDQQNLGNVNGLLALWEPGTASNAISGTGSSQQTAQLSSANALWFLAEQFHGQILSVSDPAYGGYLVGEDVGLRDLVQIAGDVLSWQEPQISQGDGKQAIVASGESAQAQQVSEGYAVWGISGEAISAQSAASTSAHAEMVDVELELMTLIMMAA